MSDKCFKRSSIRTPINIVAATLAPRFDIQELLNAPNELTLLLLSYHIVQDHSCYVELMSCLDLERSQVRSLTGWTVFGIYPLLKTCVLVLLD